jgi:hypothetical protein
MTALLLACLLHALALPPPRVTAPPPPERWLRENERRPWRYWR